MPGIAELALGAAPIAGGALLGVAAGNLKPPDIRGNIAKDMDLLERIPDDQPELKARLKDSIDRRIDALIKADERSREIRIAAMSYTGNWRDIVVFICALLFTIIWWNVSHSRANWLVMFIVMIIVSVVAGIYAGRGLLRAVAMTHFDGEGGLSQVDFATINEIYAEQLYPGGMLSKTWTEEYNDCCVSLDQNRTEAIKKYAYFGDRTRFICGYAGFLGNGIISLPRPWCCLSSRS